MSDLNVALVFRANDQASGAITRLSQKLKGLSDRSGLTEVAKKAGIVGDRFGGVIKQAGLLAVAGGGVLGLVSRAVVTTAAEFEKFGAILETTEGSAEGARKALDWVSEFAAKTPFELAEVTDNFVKLRAYGLDPTTGLLRTLGDTAAAMGKPLSQAVEAIADAVTGENERLKEFGIKASKAGNKIIYEYTQNGVQMQKVAQRSNRAMIQATLEGIFNAKYAGAMEKMSNTWGGMVSNLSDQWTRFVNMVAAAGVFDFLKGKLQGFLAEVDRMAADGTLQALAQTIGDNLVTGLKAAWQAFSELLELLKTGWTWLNDIKDVFGSWKPILVAVAAVIAGPLLAAIVSLGTAVIGLSTALAATPIGLIAAGLAGLVTAAVLLYEKWDWVAKQLTAIWDGLVAKVQPLINAVTGAFGAIGRLFGSAAPASPSAADNAPQAASAKPSFSGQVDVRLAGAPKGSRVENLQARSSPGLDVDLGMMMVP